MIIEQFFTNCLSHAAYYIESNGEAAIIDPLRDSDAYLQKAKENGARIKYVLETHFHADFVSGHLDLAAKTGAAIVFGPTAQPNYKARIAEPNELLSLGNIQIKVLHTPGHTLESVCYLLIDEQGVSKALFTGDTLFIGDVGRPDLAIKGNLSVPDLAGMLYDSIHRQILSLPDDVIIYPGHGAGSLCGKNLSKERVSNIGAERIANYALQAATKEQFINLVTDGLSTPPQYFPKNAKLNRNGYSGYDEIVRHGKRGLSIEEFEHLMQSIKALVLDARTGSEFANGHIPNSINIGLNGQFAPWVGALIKDIEQPILLVTSEGKEKETVTRLTRVGYDNSLGCLKGGFDSWKNAGKHVAYVKSISAQEYVAIGINDGKAVVLDLRRKSEYDTGHLKGAVSLPLDDINEWQSKRDKSVCYYLYCGSGYRSMVAASILKSKGFNSIIDLAGGMSAIRTVETILIEQANQFTYIS